MQPGAADDLPLPGVARDLQKHLEATVAGFQASLGPTADSGTWFLSVVDASSEASLAKARNIQTALSARYAVKTRDRSPHQAGVPDGDTYHPALRIRGVWVEEESADTVRGLLKRALYTPAKSGLDRFKLDRHGLLVGPSEAATE